MNLEQTASQYYSSFIPCSFELGGLKIDVEIAEDSSDQTFQDICTSDLWAQKMVLCPGSASRQIIDLSFIRELVKVILVLQGCSDLKNDKGFVETFSSFLYQAYSTGRGWPDPFSFLTKEHTLSVFSEDGPGQGVSVADIDGEEPFINDADIEDEDLSMAMRQEWHDAFDEDFEIEEQHQEGCYEHWSEFSDYADDWARSDDEGWFYEDGD